MHPCIEFREMPEIPRLPFEWPCHFTTALNDFVNQFHVIYIRSPTHSVTHDNNAI